MKKRKIILALTSLFILLCGGMTVHAASDAVDYRVEWYGSPSSVNSTSATVAYKANREYLFLCKFTGSIQNPIATCRAKNATMYGSYVSNGAVKVYGAGNANELLYTGFKLQNGTGGNTVSFAISLSDTSAATTICNGSVGISALLYNKVASEAGIS